MSVKFREDFGCYWPDYDHKPERCFRMIQSYVGDVMKVVELCPEHRICVQAGGHAGFWPKKLSEHFGGVYTFEPEPVLFECLQRNIIDTWQIKNVHMSDKALGDRACEVRFKSHPSAGSWSVREDGEFIIEQIPIDSLNLPFCDAIFLDVEGYELNALIGAERTIRQYQPIMQIEVCKRTEIETNQFLSDLGYKLIAQGRDSIYAPGG